MSEHEIEVKIYTPDLDQIEKRLKNLGAELKHPRVFERNVRYENASETLTERGIVVRLRQDDHVRLTYKGGNTLRNGIMTREELEVDVSDFDTMNLLLHRLGYHHHMIYEKYRTTYALDETEIVLDELPYGHFTEIEGDEDTIERLIERLELGDMRRMSNSYTGIFDNLCEKMDLNFRDLTFENFKGIHIPSSAFQPSQA